MADTIESPLVLETWKIMPPKEKLLEKISGLENDITRYEHQKPASDHEEIKKVCRENLKTAKELQKAWFSHPHLAWRYLHHVDEDLILLMPVHELAAKVLDVRTAFDLTIKEEKVRQTWLGDKGKLTQAIDDIAGTAKDIDQDRYTVKEALRYLNDIVDHGFWKLSMNILVGVYSALILAAVMVVYLLIKAPYLLPSAVLGLLGAYVSILLTREDILFVWGGPYFRYLLYNLVARPVVGAYTAVFFFILEKSKLIFSINPLGQVQASAVHSGLANADSLAQAQTTAAHSSLINIGVPADTIEYASYIFAFVLGFAGEKALRNMMDKVLKRLEAKAEKTKEANPVQNGEKPGTI
jgi:hypothetical protein